MSDPISTTKTEDLDAETLTDLLSSGTFLRTDAVPRAPDSRSSDRPSPDATKSLNLMKSRLFQ